MMEHERFYMEGNLTQIMNFFMRYSRLGHNEVIHAGQKLYRYTKFETHLRKRIFSRFPPRFILGRILRIVMTFVKFWDSSYNRSHETIHLGINKSNFPTINLLCSGSIIMLSMLKLHDLWK